MNKNHEIKISYPLTSGTATWTVDGQQPDPIVIAPRDTISFLFVGHGTITNAILLTGPLQGSSTSSPFIGGNQFTISQDYKLSNTGVSGRWGFTVSFAVTANSITSFYYLPDPELEVGSTEPGSEFGPG